MKIRLLGAEDNIIKALAISSEYLCFDGEELLVSAVKDDINGYKIINEENRKIVVYGTIGDFLSAVAIILGGENGEVSRIRAFEKTGIMIDCARNGVPSIEFLKRFIVSIAFSGYNYLGLYLEDCFEVDGEPYFGYMRGRYTQNEIREIVSFAENFGVEIIPYIQTLAHLSRIFVHWEQYYDKIRDVNDILLIDEPRTYVLIENMIKTCAKVFKSKSIHIGMDEAFMMLLGKYRELHGIVSRAETLLRHTEKVCEICKKYDLNPIAWSDMFERYGQSHNFKVPENLTLNPWNYYCTEENDYLNHIKKCQKLTDKVVFTGGGHKWYGYAPLNEFSELTALPSVRASKGRVSNYCLSLWCDEGSECFFNNMWYTILKVYSESLDKRLSSNTLDGVSRFITGYSLKENLCLDLPNKVFDGKMKRPINPSKYVFYEDILFGNAEFTVNPDYKRYFMCAKTRLKNLSRRKSTYSGFFEHLSLLCSVLEKKCNLRLDILNAYKNGDKTALKEIAEKQIPEVVKRIKKFSAKNEELWHREYKPFVYEVQIIRISGLIGRLLYVKSRLEDYILGKVTLIPELEEENLSCPINSDNGYNGAMCYNSYEQTVSYGMISHKLFN